ncbi:unnamed protein product [Mytilus edulis]|uniref:Uncharacterized protein n=1 Tax=Mytilus edulis TaxID=6550 RepID=A0A8S3PXE6_MYTED|nr:unnamed protein product [Mytilus edulis]
MISKITGWEKAYRSFNSCRRLNLPTKRTMLIYWQDYTEGFMKREPEECIFRTLQDQGKLYYSGDMFDSWIYFSPIDLKDREWYEQNCDLDLIKDEQVQSEIHHLSMAVKAADLEGCPGTSSPDLLSTANRQEDSPVSPSPIVYLYWEARAQGFHNLRGKLFAEAFVRLLFMGVDHVTFSYSAAGLDTHLDRWGYVKKGPSKRPSGCSDDICNQVLSHAGMNSKDQYLTVLKNQESVEFNLEATSLKAESDIFVWRGNKLVLVAIVTSINDSGQRKMQQLQRNMLLSLDGQKTLFGLVIQGHNVTLAEYTFEQNSREYKRSISETAFSYTKIDINLLYSYVQKHFAE